MTRPVPASVGSGREARDRVGSVGDDPVAVVGAAIGVAVVSSVLFGALPATFTPGKAQVAQITRDYLQEGPAAVKQAITNSAYRDRSRHHRRDRPHD
jgi:hypothetical protein